MNDIKKYGVWPTMITPYGKNGEIDYGVVRAIVTWYMEKRCQGIFAVCQSSEMNYLSLRERITLSRAVVDTTKGKITVVASGHISTSQKDQINEISAMADTGVEAVVLVTNRMASQDESDTIWIKNTERILNSLPNLRLGLYECPYPYKRILNRQIIEWCAKTNRFDFLKDTCCDADLIKDRLAWIRMSGNVGFKLYNANSATLLQSLHDGAAGFTGVMANMHPDLYVWLCEHFNKESDLACQLQAFLSLASMAETLTYPVCAKYHMNLDGVAMLLKSRSEDVIHFNKAQRLLIDHLYTMENTMRGMLAIKKGH